MSSPATSFETLGEALALRCERLAHPGATGDERQAHGRLIASLLAAPFLAGAAIAVTLPGTLGPGALAASLAAPFIAAWLCCLALAVSGRREIVEPAALVVSAATLAVVIAAAGGPLSPFAALSLALPIEAMWLRRGRLRLLAAATAAAMVLAAQPMLAGHFPARAATALDWLVPLLYGATVAARLSWRSSTLAQRAGPSDLPAESLVLRLGSGGEVTEAGADPAGLLGISPQLLLDGGLFERLHVTDRVAFLAALGDLRAGGGARRVEARLRLPPETPGGATRFGEFILTMVRSGEGFSVAVRDHGEVARLRRELAEARRAGADIEQAQMRMLGAVSHDLRTPLGAVVGFADMLLHEVHGALDDARQRDCVRLIKQSGEHLLGVVDSVLDVSRLAADAFTVAPEAFRFKDAAELCFAMLAREADERRVTLRCRLSGEAGSIKADRRAVQRILVNLLSNAVKFTPPGGEVEIGARRLGSRLHFWVSDTGVGIAESDLAAIGRPFARLGAASAGGPEGCGLGLSLVKGLVKLHQGTMSIASEPGHGTTVTISLPVDGPEQHKAAAIVRLAGAEMRENGHEALRRTA